MTKRIGELLVEAGRLRTTDLNRALTAQETTSELLGVLLVRLGLVSERDVGEALSAQLNLPLVAAADYPADPLLEESLPVGFLRTAQALPLAQDGEVLKLAMARPQDSFSSRAVAMATGLRVQPVLGLPSDIAQAIEKLYGTGRSALGQIIEQLGEEGAGQDTDDIEQLKDMASEAPVIRMVNLIITRAIESRASDIHIEPFEGTLKVRYRIDGVMHEVESPPARLTAAIISRLKIMAHLNIAERRLPQDGRIQLRVQGKEIDLRVSSVPTMHGESVVMRILDKGSITLDLDAMGFHPEVLARFKDVLALPHGIVLVTGPTGSGKTTTLYAALARLNTPERKILTVEDPVEYQIAGVNQIQANPKIGLDFAHALRSIVRQDPDVIMIGEMRDQETARIAIQSALTGHLVLSTVHTNDAASGVTRLVDMGLEPYLLTATVNCIMAQRLVRRLCPHCAEAFEAPPELVADLGLDRYAEARPHRLWRARGCPECADTGYHGRTAIHELLMMDEPIQRLVLAHADAETIEKAARARGMLTMYEDGLRKALSGITTVEEVLRVTQETADAVV